MLTKIAAAVSAIAAATSFVDLMLDTAQIAQGVAPEGLPLSMAMAVMFTGLTVWFSLSAIQDSIQESRNPDNHDTLV